MILQIQGQKCKKYFPKPSTKKPVKISLFLEEQRASLTINNPRSKQKYKRENNSINFSHVNNEIILSSELPAVPFYMPKFMSRTPSPLRGTRSNLKKLRTNLFPPNHNSISQDPGILSGKRTSMGKPKRKENIKSVKKTENFRKKKSFKKFFLKDLELQLPSLNQLRKMMKKKKKFLNSL